MNKTWLNIAKKIQSIAQAGLTYGKDPYDIERYNELRNLSIEIISNISDIKTEKIRHLFANEKGYQTPKVDIRSVIFKENKILMVKEKVDDCWSLPGGWADIGLSPKETAVKEVKEEAGFLVVPKKMMAVFDEKCHNHPLSPYYAYKMFIECEIVGGKMEKGMETSDVAFFSETNLPELSKPRNTKEQLLLMFDLKRNPEKGVLFD